MNRLTCALLYVLLLIVGHNYGQNFKPIPDDTTAHWRIYGSKVLSETCYRTYRDWFYISGTQVVNNKTYYNVFSKGHWIDHPILPYGTCSGSGYTYDVFEGAICTVNDTVYCIVWGWEYILFDYNLKVGDTVPNDYKLTEDYYWGITTISLIDSVLTSEGEYLKRWHLNFDYDKHERDFDLGWFIEGIGSEFGLFHANNSSSEHSTELQCYSENYEPYYPAGSNCDPTVNIADRKRLDSSVRTFPNPFSSYITIAYQLDEGNEVTLNIFDHCSKLVHQVHEKQQPGDQSITWQPQGLPSGMYYFTLQAGDHVSTGKLVKMQ